MAWQNRVPHMTLHHGLTGVRVMFARHAAPRRPSLFEAGLGTLRRSGILEAAIGAGQHAPDFELPGMDGAAVGLGSLLRCGPVVLTFFRGGWCEYCSLQLSAYQTMLPELTSLGARLVAVSPQRPELSRSVAAQHGLQFDVLHDSGNLVAQLYGLMFPVPQSWQQAYAGNGIKLPEINGSENWNLPVPATFVIEPSGRMALSYVDADYRNRLEPAEILAGIRSLQLAPPTYPPHTEPNAMPQKRNTASRR